MSQTSQIRDDARRDPDVLQREIDATRADVGRTLDELQARLSPGQLLDQALGMFKEHGGEMARNAGDAIKQNPIPMLLTGIGLVWLMASQRRGYGGPAYDTAAGTGEVDYGLYDAEHDSSTYVETEVHLESEDQSPGMREKMKSAASAARDRASHARESLSRGAASISGGAHQLGDRARYRAQRTREGFSELMQEQPLIAGIAALAIGAVVGATLPATRREDELMGEARDRALERAKAAGEEQYEKARETVKQAAEGARQSIEERQQGAQSARPSAQERQDTQAAQREQPGVGVPPPAGMSGPTIGAPDGNGAGRPTTTPAGGYGR